MLSKNFSRTSPLNRRSLPPRPGRSLWIFLSGCQFFLGNCTKPKAIRR